MVKEAEDNMALEPYGNESDDENAEENVIEIIQEFGTNRLMTRAHEVIKQQLEDSKVRLVAEILDKEEELKRLKNERENLGVQLYSLQQQLSRVQISLENAHNEYNNLVDSRLQEEENFKSMNYSNEEKKALVNEYKKQQKKYNSELESLYETIQQIDKYNEEVKSEIAITRRAAYKTEQSMQELEKHKESQDVFVDNLNKKIKTLQEQITLYANQYESQTTETREAAAVLQETANELELISNEKKQLMIQWKTALSGLSRRDEALAQATKTLSAAESSVHDYDVEIDAVKRDIQKEQARNESLVNMKDRMESELQWVEENISKMKIERDQLQERYALLMKSLNQTDAESKKLDQQSKQLNTDADTLLQNIQVVTQERQKLEDEIAAQRAAKLNVSKTVDNLSKEQIKILKQIHDIENEGNDVDNELARTRVDKLNAMAINDQIKEQFDALSTELRDRENLIGKYQVEIRQRNDDVEKKMYRVDRLNKKYEKMVETAGGEENLGPLENTIRMLKKSTEDVSDECKELERDWLKKQTELVSVTAESENIHEKNNETQARITILTQQQVRLSKDLRSCKSEVKVGTQLLADLQKDVAKLNALINENNDNEGKLQHDNFILERGLLDELKQMEQECLGLESSIQDSKGTKAKLLDEIIDTERQAQMWEKKIQLDKEMKEALDPSVGQAETQNMEKEIHRMELRLTALNREQERLCQEIERALLKRVSISNRYSKRGGASGGGNGVTTAMASSGSSKKSTASMEMTQAGVKKRIGNMKRDLRVVSEEMANVSAFVEEKKIALHDMTNNLERATSEYGLSEEICHQLQEEINNMLYQKQLLQERLSYRQKYLKRLKELSQNGVDVTMSLQIERKLLSTSQSIENVQTIINDIKDQFPHLSEVLDRVAIMTDPDIEVPINL